MYTPATSANPPEPARPPRRRWRAAAWAAGSVAVLAVSATAGLWWWAGTDGSLATALGWIGRSQPLSAERVTGSLRAGGHVDQLVWQRDGLRVDVRDVTLAWQPWSLLHGTLKLNRLAAASVQVDDQRPPSTTPSVPPSALGLPLPVVLDGFSVGQLQWTGGTVFSASGIAGNYAFNGLAHQLELLSAQVARGRYNGRAVLSSRSPLRLDASLAGALDTLIPGGKTALPLAFKATAHGPLAELLVKAELQMEAQPPARKTPLQPQASATARVMPWAAQPLPQADASFRDLDVAAFWPRGPQTLLTGSASVRPAENSGAPAASAWLLQLQLANALPGPWDQQKLPLERLEAQGEWRGSASTDASKGAAMVRTLKARLGGGELLASGEWADARATPRTAGAPPAWKLQATLRNVNPALLHTQLAPLPLDGKADVRSQGAAIAFEANMQAARNDANAKNNPLGPLRLRDASATGSWNTEQAGGTLVLSTLRVRTDDAELAGQLEAQPAAKGGKGKLTLTAPGLDAQLQGELRPASGKGEVSVHGSDMAQALRWLQKLPGLPASLKTASASGSAELQASWQGGWQDPALQARLELSSLDWRRAASTPAPANTAMATTAATATTTAEALKIRAFQATLSGRLSQAQLSTQGRIEVDQRRFSVQLAGEGGRVKPPAAPSEATWQGLLKTLSVSVEDPALGSGAWRLATRGTVPLKWTPTRSGGAFESGAGEALLSAPSGAISATTPSQATLSWQPLRWRPGEFISAGKLSGLPMAWIELLAGPQMAGAGLGGNLLLDGEWNATLGETLRLNASLARSSGDITVQAEAAQGGSARVAAGVRQARLSLLSEGEALTLALRWDSERAGTAEGQLKTRLARAPAGSGGGGWSHWSWPADAPLSGQLRAQLPRIGVWSLLAPPGWRLRGSLGADVAISGTRAAPQLAGDLQANDLALRSVVDGIEFGNGRLRARLDGTRMRINEFTLQGAGEKGTGGTLTAQGEAGWIDGRPQVQLDARLQRLRASLRTDRKLTVSGEVQASLKGGQTELNGRLVVDEARIILPDEGTPQLGDDVVVRSASGAAAGQQAPAQTSGATADKEARPVKLAVQIDLGPDFRVQGKGIDTRIRGSLALDGDSLREPRLTGTVRTAGGQYRAYGQRLDVEQGVLRFTGPIANPALDILAIRPNLTQRVGVQITGTALLPSVRLYAQPELPDAEKLSWLIVGRAAASGGAEAALLQQAALALLGSKSGGMSGGLAAALGLDELSFRGASSSADGSTTEGAVTLGKRFSRNFYAAYERSVSGALGTLYVFYDLSRRFTVRAQAGNQSAVDLIFTIPYD
ncbi:translocation/assembly module TamB domain-containing protein [Polaromonas jejuensis]|uniref:Translocation/assembly module TamB domain-containing protein n=1 Tax=Polaromonas jejuensis TaxID=457502 RepID=A0ABW0Q728_9BURK|nr:translocation/assembly module TamB domain-containing protein [Polaromonas jejuensis]